jgi:LmbE family N-acetylglucosaminyl deacetylase
VAAAAIAGIAGSRVRSLGLVDQEVALALEEAAAGIADDILTLDPEVVVTQPYEGGHPDHDAVALAARMALRRIAPATPLLEMTSYHARAGALETGRFLDDAGSVAIPLDADARAAKLRMLEAFGSQRDVLAPFRRDLDVERFRPAPIYDFLSPPHAGPLHYESLGWPMTGARFRSLAARVLARWN